MGTGHNLIVVTDLVPPSSLRVDRNKYRCLWWFSQCLHQAIYRQQYLKDMYSINLNGVEINVNLMCFPMLFHNPLNDCLNFKKYQY